MSGFTVRIIAMTLLALSGVVRGEDWLQWGRDDSRNMAHPQATRLPDTFNAGRYVLNTDRIDMATTKNVKWVAKLGSQAYGNPTVSHGKVFVGTNNESPQDPRHEGDYGILQCLDEATGEFLWQLTVPKLGSGKVNDWEYLGICSSPQIKGDRVYLVTNRCEIICLDIHGMADGNDGPFMDEGQYLAGAGNPPVEIAPTDADILWVFDMREELGVFPHNIASSSVLILGDRLYAATSNGQDWSHKYIPSPRAPVVAVVDKNTGEYLGEEASGISERLYHSGWSSPAAGEVNGRMMVFVGAGDGFCYAFEPEPVPHEEGINALKEIWRFDCNPADHKVDGEGNPRRYPTAAGPSEIIATPVFYKNRVYVSVGQDPEHGEGVGALSCIDATQTGDITDSGKLWQYTGISRSISTVSILDGLLYVADYSGKVHCLDADSGEVYWVHDTRAHIWGSTFAADGKVYIGNEDGILTILAAGKELKLLAEVEMPSAIYSTPIVAKGVMYIGTQTHLYAIEASQP